MAQIVSPLTLTSQNQLNTGLQESTRVVSALQHVCSLVEPLLYKAD